ncbi:MAG: hypothetical protein DSZ28_08130 [Thiothrix sp.]|nr:MAG: hypothetical protein DSZ28_08130 [Thiothrix sp.]
MYFLSDLNRPDLVDNLHSFGLLCTFINSKDDIPGSYWGDSEAGLIGNRLYLRSDTPVHSLLHEACHYLCMPKERRTHLHTDAGGDYDEENAVCYSQIILADRIKGYSSEDCMRDMDEWGYTFRLGSAKKWFNEDASDARLWLIERNLLDSKGNLVLNQ